MFGGYLIDIARAKKLLGKRLTLSDIFSIAESETLVWHGYLKINMKFMREPSEFIITGIFKEDGMDTAEVILNLNKELYRIENVEAMAMPRGNMTFIDIRGRGVQIKISLESTGKSYYGIVMGFSKY